jgi:hypothetical protein
MLIKTGCNNIVLHLLFTNVNNIVQHYCCTPFKMNNIVQCCQLTVKNRSAKYCCNLLYSLYSRLSVFGRVEPTLLYDRKQRPKMEISNSSRFILACKLLAIPNEGSYLRGYGVMTEQTRKQNNIDIMPHQI